MTVYITGDTHGGADLQKLRGWDYENKGQLTTDDYLIVAGDFGYPWDFGPEECDEIFWLETRPYTVLFVDGNHERYDHWAERPYERWHGGLTQRLSPDSPIRRLCRGEVFELEGQRIFTFGGATSVDKDLRVPGVDWWPQELPSEENIEHAIATLETNNWQVDYVITHTCSTRMLSFTLWPSSGWQHPETDILTNFLDMLEDELSYKRWYYGHFHRDSAPAEKHTVLYDEVVSLGQSVKEALTSV